MVGLGPLRTVFLCDYRSLAAQYFCFLRFGCHVAVALYSLRHALGSLAIVGSQTELIGFVFCYLALVTLYWGFCAVDVILLRLYIIDFPPPEFWK